MACPGDRTLAECFRLFDIIHRCTTSHAVIARLAREVAEDFAADNVIYLELRTTPKVSATLFTTSAVDSLYLKYVHFRETTRHEICNVQSWRGMSLLLSCLFWRTSFEMKVDTLQDRPEHGITKRSYIEAVLAGLREYAEAAGKAQISCVQMEKPRSSEAMLASYQDSIETAVQRILADALRGGKQPAHGVCIEKITA